MANWTDTVPTFNPYIQQLPVEAMVTVGMEKQKRYDEGVQRIQQSIDRVAGLDIYRDVDRQHLQSKLNQLGTKLRTVAAGDFSNYQLVNSVSGMASKIAKDPNVIAAVQSTAVIKNNQQIMEEAREKGNLTPQNETYYNKRLSSYLNAGLTDVDGKPIKFNEKYIPYFDHFKYAKEVFDSVKPDGMTWDQVYVTDENGIPKTDAKGQPIYSPTMIRMEKEGLFPQKVKETLNQIFSDPRVSQQLQIDGEYNYSQVSPETLKSRIVEQARNVEVAISDEISRLTLLKNSSQSEAEKKQISDQISNLQNSATLGKEQYAKLLEATEQNPDAVKGLLYKDEVKNRYTTMFGYMKTKQTTMSNPGWEANFKIDQEAFDRYKWQKDYDYRAQNDALNRSLRMREIAAKELEAAAKANPNLFGETELANMSANYDVKMDFEENLQRAADDYSVSSNDFIFKVMYQGNPEEDKRYEQLRKTNTPEEAIAVIIEQDAKKAGMEVGAYRTMKAAEAMEVFNRKGSEKIDFDLADAMQQYTISKRTFQDLNYINQQRNDIVYGGMNGTIAELMSGNEIKPQKIKYRGQEIELSKSDIIDLGVMLRGQKTVFGMFQDDAVLNASKSAEERLNRKGLQGIVNYVLRAEGRGGITDLIRTVGKPIETGVDLYTSITGSTNIDINQIKKVYDKLNTDEWSKTLDRETDFLKRNYVTSPSSKQGLFTGDSKKDNATLMNIKRIAGEFRGAGNLSPDFENFKSAISKLTDPKKATLSLERQLVGGTPQSQIVLYGDNSERVGSMVIQEDEARRFTSPSNFFVPSNITSTQNFINFNNGKTSSGLPNVETFLREGGYLMKSNGDFPNLTGLNGIDVMAHITTNDRGGYYGKIFINDLDKKFLNTPIVYTTPPQDLPTLMATLSSMSASQIMPIISEYKIMNQSK